MTKKPYHILLADDDEGDRLIFKKAFSDLKIDTVIHTVNNGVELLERLNMKDIPLPYLIFLDLNMTPINGLESLKEIRSAEKLKDILIAIYSTSNAEKDLHETFINGANIYITKPNDFNVLKKVLEKAVATAFLYQDQTLKRENFLLLVE
jgi:CheY-like chemotaxis protein